MDVKINKPSATLIKIMNGRRKGKNGGNYEYVLISYRDENGVKKTRFHERAKTHYYLLKDKNIPEAIHPPRFIEKDKVVKCEVFSDMLFRDIAQKTNSMGFYDQVTLTSGESSYDMRNLYKHPLVYDADMDISDRYISEFLLEYEVDKKYILHKTYFDIEVDLMSDGFVKNSKGQIGYVGFPDEEKAPCPINILTLIDEKDMKVYSFIHENEKNDSLLEFKKDVDKFKRYLLDKINEEDFKEFGLEIKDIDIRFYPTELDTIKAFFEVLHELNPDFAGAWNMSFDIQTIYNRLKQILAKDPNVKDAEYEAGYIMSDKSMLTQYNSTTRENINLYPTVRYRAEKDKKVDNRFDVFTIIDGITWIDSMTTYAALRKHEGSKESYSLDAIANDELGREKLEFEEHENIKNLPWLNFSKFVEYNIRDTVLLILIERKGMDYDTIQRLSEITNTRKERVLRKTISLKNYLNKYAVMSGFIMNNNSNQKYGTYNDYFERTFMNNTDINESDVNFLELLKKKDNYGAIVGDPNINVPMGSTELTGSPSKYIYLNVIDFDFTALYPSVIIAYNIDTATKIGKFYLIDDEIEEILLGDKYDYENLYVKSKNSSESKKTSDEENILSNDLGPAFADSIIAQDWSKVGEKFFNLPNIEEILLKLEINLKNKYGEKYEIKYS